MATFFGEMLKRLLDALAAPAGAVWMFTPQGNLQHQRMGQLAGQQQLWTQLEAFARQVHGSLKPLEVAYITANEGRRLIDCDRVCVALRQAGSTTIEAVSGADVVEKRSALIKL